MRFININGKIMAEETSAIPIDNGAFRYGYGLFETMLVVDGSLDMATWHWERLEAGAKQLYFELPPLSNAQWMEDEVLRTVGKNKMNNLCRVRMQLFAAGGGLYGLETNRPGYLIECFSLDPENLVLNTNGLTVGVATGLTKSTDTLSNLKSANALIYAIAARQAMANKWNDALICNTADKIIESTIANIFWIKDGNIYTPPLTDGCVAGIMRRYVMARISGIEERSLEMAELLDADEVFLTNAVKKMRWVGSLGERIYTCQKVKDIYSSL